MSPPSDTHTFLLLALPPSTVWELQAGSSGQADRLHLPLQTAFGPSPQTSCLKIPGAPGTEKMGKSPSVLGFVITHSWVTLEHQQGSWSIPHFRGQEIRGAGSEPGGRGGGRGPLPGLLGIRGGTQDWPREARPKARAGAGRREAGDIGGGRGGKGQEMGMNAPGHEMGQTHPSLKELFLQVSTGIASLRRRLGQGNRPAFALSFHSGQQEDCILGKGQEQPLEP